MVGSGASGSWAVKELTEGGLNVVLFGAGRNLDIVDDYPAIHETGGARMGDTPDNSVLNSYCQCWDVDNVFVTDGACFVSSGFQNPTLTMMALTVRACRFIVRDYVKCTN